MQWLKQSTAATAIVGPVLDSAGAEFTTLALTDLNISKNGGTPAAITSGTLTHVANGWYTLAFATGNVDTLGRLDITCTLATKQLPPKAFMVLPATVFDAFVTNAAGGANGLLLSLASNQVDVGKLLGTAWLTPAVAGTPDVNAKQLGGAAVTATTSVTIPAASTLATTTGAVGSVTGAVGSVTGAVGSVTGAVGSVTGAVGSVTGSVGSVTGAVGSVGAGGIAASSFAAGAIDATAIATDAIGSAEISAAAVTKIQAGLATPTNITAGTITTVTTVTNQLTAAQIATGVWQDATAGDFTTANSVGKSLYNAFTAGTSVYTAAALVNAPSGTGASAATIATAVWTDLLASSDFSTAASIGKLLKDDVDATISSRMATYTQPTGFLAATFPSGTIANTTNITAGTITTVTTVTTCGTLTTYTGNTPQTGDAYARIGAAGVGLTSVSVVSTGLDAVLVDGKTLPAALRIIASSVIGKISGAGTGTEVFVGLDGATTRATVTVDASGNRSAVVYG